MAKLNLQQPLFQSSVSHSQITLICCFAAQETFIISSNEHLFEIEIFYNIINIFTVNFDQFNTSLLSKSINFLLTPNFWMIVYLYTK